MVRLFLILALILLPTVSEANYKWANITGEADKYYDFYNSTETETGLTFYEMNDNINYPIRDRVAKSAVNQYHLNCSNMVLNYNVNMFYSGNFTNGEMFIHFTHTDETKKETEQVVTPEANLYDVLKNSCDVLNKFAGSEEGLPGIEVIQILWSELHNTQYPKE